MGHDDDCAARVAQLTHLAKQALGGIQIQRGGRLVQYQDTGLAQQSAPDGDPLLNIQRQQAHQHVGVDRHTRQGAHQRFGGVVFFLLSQRAGPQAVGAHVKVFQHRAFVCNQYFLEYRGNAGRASLMRRRWAQTHDRDLP